MSDYLYNILVRSFGLVETAQPRLSSVFEPLSDFRPVDALENYLPTEEGSLALHEGERRSPASSARSQGAAPRQMAQPAARYDSPTNADVSSSAQPLMESPAAGNTSAGRDAYTQSVEAAHSVGEPSQATTYIESQTESTPAAFVQASPQGKMQPHAQPGHVPSTSIREDTPIDTSVAHDSTFDRTVRAHERAAFEALPKGEENLSHVSSDRQSQAETNARIPGETHRIPGIEERTRLVEHVTEQRIVGRAASQESQPPSLNNESPAAGQQPHSLSQRMKAAASEGVAAVIRPPQQTQASILLVAPKRGDAERHETVIAQPQLSRYVEIERPESPRKARGAVPEQIVQVTIGRIEVRASSPPGDQTKAQQKTARQPSQSLEEYLRQRGQQGGGSGR